MNNGTKKGFAMGTTVALNADVEDMFPSLAKTIWTVVDARRLPGGTVYTLHQPNGCVEGVSGDDLHEVGRGF